MTDEPTEAGWYPDPWDDTGTVVRRWSGTDWESESRDATDEERKALTWPRRDAPAAPERAAAAPRGPVFTRDGFQIVSVRLQRFTAAAFVLLLLAVLWAGAEAHDSNCYTKAGIQAVSGSEAKASCLILPWNEPE